MTRNPTASNNIAPGVAGGIASSFRPPQRGQWRGLTITPITTRTPTRISSHAVPIIERDRSFITPYSIKVTTQNRNLNLVPISEQRCDSLQRLVLGKDFGPGKSCEHWTEDNCSPRVASRFGTRRNNPGYRERYRIDNSSACV